MKEHVSHGTSFKIHSPEKKFSNWVAYIKELLYVFPLQRRKTQISGSDKHMSVVFIKMYIYDKDNSFVGQIYNRFYKKYNIKCSFELSGILTAFSRINVKYLISR